MDGPSYDLRRCTIRAVEHLFLAHHGYKSVGRVAVAAFAVYEDDRPVAAFIWQPPPPGAALALAPSASYGVLALSRMVAVPREERRLRHISKPLRRIMRTELDRGRWPVLVTYSDASMGHTGHVYMCSGWRKESTSTGAGFTDANGCRRSPYSNGEWTPGSLKREVIELTRWTHRVCEIGQEAAHIEAAGWAREPIPGKFWRSGSPAMRLVRVGAPG